MCREQVFYDDTLIVVIGDHPRMDSELVGDVADHDRTNYNLFLNVDAALSDGAQTIDRLPQSGADGGNRKISGYAERYNLCGIWRIAWARCLPKRGLWQGLLQFLNVLAGAAV